MLLRPARSKACINQSDIEMSLKVLPIYLALTQTLLIVAGPTYHKRLWCVIEIFTFLRMGADLERVVLRPMLDAGELESDSTQSIHLAELKTQFEAFRVQEADCYSSDRSILLGAIETGFHSIDEFNALCSRAMVTAVDHATSDPSKSFNHGVARSFTRKVSDAGLRGLPHRKMSNTGLQVV